MANEFTEIKVIECNRLHSEEALSKNNDNYSLWTNNLTDVITLDAGDRISVHSSMISERGAGQPDSIEIKGVNLGFQKDFTFTEITNTNASSFLPTGYETISSNASVKTISIRDDTLNFALTYYQTANAHNYIQLPRRFWYNASDSEENQWRHPDSFAAGQTGYNILIERDKFSFKGDFSAIDVTRQEEEANLGQRCFKHKNDNSRYTLLIRDNTYYTEANASGNLGGYIDSVEGSYNASLGRSRDPENAIYNIYKELKSISLSSGFNSPQTIADDITRQFQKITDEKIHKIPYTSAQVPADSLATSIPVYRTISTETYKPFNVANIFRTIFTIGSPLDYGIIEGAFNEYNASTTGTKNASGWDYLSQYQIIGTLRPELYETGI